MHWLEVAGGEKLGGHAYSTVVNDKGNVHVRWKGLTLLRFVDWREEPSPVRHNDAHVPTLDILNRP